MSNLVYQATVEELEAILSPRVVSRSLQEGLRQLGRSPDTVDYAAVEKILKAQVYRQLQVTMPVTQAKEAIAGILERLQEVHTDGRPAASHDSGLTRQGERLEQLASALRPFNLYFEWPEVQKLRAQIQLLESEQRAAREAASLADDAEAQLRIVEQKLEDQLVIQARELGELSEALEQVRTLGGPKVRRLENLVNQIGSAQHGRQLAPAEIERARRLARDLRRLVESSVYGEAGEGDAGGAAADPQARNGPAPAAANEARPVHGGVLEVEGEEEEDLLFIDAAELAPEVSAKLLLLDLEDERHDLEQLAGESRGLLAYRPALAERFDALRARLDGDASVSEELEGLRRDLAEAFDGHRQALQDELQDIEAWLAGLRPEVDVSELRQALRVALGILETTLPSQADIQHVRNLHRLAREQVDALERAEDEVRARREAQLAEQSTLLERLDSTLLRYREHGGVEEYRALQAELDALRAAHARQVYDPGVVDRSRRSEASLESRMAQLAEEQVDRQRATLRNLLARVKAMPALATVAERIDGVVAEIERQLRGLERGLLDDRQLAASATLVDGLRDEVTATLRRRLEELTEQAGELGSAPLLERIRAAGDALDAGAYPELAGLRAAVEQEREAERSEQIGDLHRLEREAARLSGMEGPTLAALQERLAVARERIDQGLLAPGLSHAWGLLERLEAEAEQRLRYVFPRLDAALAALRPVERLNSDDVASVRRILRHLDSQREAFERVSVGLQLQLEASLREAEALLEKLGEQYEATRVIADQLVSANVLDDVLGFLDEGSPASGGSAPATARSRARPDVDALLRPYLEREEVAGAALLRADGTTLGGRLPFGPGEAAALCAAWRRAAEQGAAALGARAADVATLEYRGGALLAAWPTPEHTFLLSLRAGADAALLSARLRRDVAALAEALGGAAGGAPHA